jgi:hypothetical protein
MKRWEDAVQEDGRMRYRKMLSVYSDANETGN